MPLFIYSLPSLSPPSALANDQVMSAEWEKSAVQELDVTATDLSTECLIDLLTRIPSLRWLSAGQLDGFTDAVSVFGCVDVCAAAAFFF